MRKMMLRIIEEYFLLFTIYSIIGWIVEMINNWFHEKKIVNRGFFIGPYIPIYGVGATLITLLLKNSPNIEITFLGSLLLCGSIEYFFSYFMEKVYKARWWDYSQKKFNINGRVCLEYLIYFGLAGVLIINFINPFIFKELRLIPNLFLNIICLIILINYLIDAKISLEVADHLKKITFKKEDNTEQVEKIKRKIINHYWRHNRLRNAFPLIREQLNEDLWQKFKK